MSRKQRGFTLVELLVVISIIGMLAALLLPAIQNAREAGRRTTCLNNMRNLGMAMQNFDGKKNKLPGWRNLLVGDPKVNANASATIPGSWVISILPDLDQSQVAEDISDKSTLLNFAQLQYRTASDVRVNLPQLNILICPSDTRQQAKSPAANLPYLSRPVTSYVANCGMPDQPVTRDQSSATLLPDKPANGVFQDNFPYYVNGTGVPQGTVSTATQSLSTIQAGDGTSTTLMFAENVDAGFYGDEYEWEIGFCWVPETAEADREPYSGAQNIRPMNKETGQVDTAIGPPSGNPSTDRARYAFARPSSNHPGGVNVVFCDGHTSFLADTVDYVVFGLLMSPKGRLTEDVRYQTTTTPPTAVRALAAPNNNFAIQNLDEAAYAN